MTTNELAGKIVADWYERAVSQTVPIGALADLIYRVEKAIAAEREACAKIVDAYEERRWRTLGEGGDLSGCSLPNIAKAIRARK